jgi:hypothetical protein
MTAVTIVGMAAGGVLILTAVAVFLIKKEFSPGGVMVTIVGLVLIGMSQWSSIKLTGAGVTLEVLRDQITQTAAAADEVAAQAENAAAGLEATKRQVANLAQLLETKQVLPATAVQPIRAQLSAVPSVDRSKLATARSKLATAREGLNRLKSP